MCRAGRMIAKSYLVAMYELGTMTCRTQEYLALDHEYVFVE